MSDDDLGFTFVTRASGDVAISRDGAVVTVLRGAAADKFRRQVARIGAQAAMARVTGNYKRGNER